MFDQLFRRHADVRRHLNAPLLQERLKVFAVLRQPRLPLSRLCMCWHRTCC